MNQYRRIVSYLYKYGNGKKGENTGFVRIDTRPEGIRLHFRIKDLRMMDEKRLKIYFYFHKGNRMQLIFVDEFLCLRGNCEYKKMVLPDFTDGDFERMNGVIFLDEQGLLYGSCWDEREISEELLVEEEVSEEGLPEAEEEEIEKTDVKPEHNSILSRYPVIPFYNSENSIQAVEIHLEDIPKLPSSEWKLADNAFLKQAYETAGHLLLGRAFMPNGGTVWLLGVPGIYENREKYLAGIFGFTDYIPLEEREYKTGGRGYWIRQIAAVE